MHVYIYMICIYIWLPWYYVVLYYYDYMFNLKNILNSKLLVKCKFVNFFFFGNITQGITYKNWRWKGNLKRYVKLV